jgi:hypothetical protein
MATNKAKRSIHLAQLQPQHAKARAGGPKPARRSPNPQPATGLMPVKVHVYRVIAELNADLEKVIQDFDRFRSISFFPAETLKSMHNALRRMRAQANCLFTRTLHARETANAEHFERLCLECAELQPENGIATAG